MNLTLWIVASVLAVVFAMAGLTKLTLPREKLPESMAAVKELSPGTIKFIGAVELLGALGLILPAVFDVAVFLTPLAAAGLAVTMLLAALTHARRGESQLIVVNVVLLALAASVAVMRFGPQPLSA
ncbi:DoxX family protein [Nocardioides donggukensis]|uniref:DoxX family protein n=1 Tax=Nocardioides donggukensis TaxID=2774019 RepID=A0A927K3H1_9ACTN|nr:DoxX family protein [Nocardioides donggukensis]MBD8868043.1 DoxX family protein [Nocardioides donggukensis]